MDTISGVVVVGLLGAFFVFGLVGYLRGKSIHSCCDVTTTAHPKKTAK